MRQKVKQQAENQKQVIFALPKKGRLYQPTLDRLSQAGITIKRNPRSDFASSQQMPELRIYFLPAKDIAKLVGQGEVDIGITGRDIIQETDVSVNELLEFSFGSCRLCVQAPAGIFSDHKQLGGKRIATSFPRMTQKFFDQECPENPPEIRSMSGSVEAACRLGFAEAVVDLVDTGDTMIQAGLVELAEIMQSKPVLISNGKAKNQQLVDKIRQWLNGVEIASRYAIIEYNIQAESRQQAEKLTPGFQSPTVMPLEDGSWVAIKAMILKSEANDLMDSLQKIGATAILVYQIASCRV